MRQTMIFYSTTVVVSTIDTAPLTSPAGTPALVSQRETVLSIIRRIFGKNTVIAHHQNGAPHIESMPQTNLAISHCKEFVAVAIDDVRRVGIDIEMQRNNSLERVIGRILLPGEDVYATTPQLRLTAWTMKEALFKALHCNNSKSNIETISQIPIPAPGESTVTIEGRTFSLITLHNIGYANATMTIALEESNEGVTMN